MGKRAKETGQASVMKWLQNTKSCSSVQQPTDSNLNYTTNTTNSSEMSEKSTAHESTHANLQHERPENTVDIVDKDGKPDNITKNTKQSEGETSETHLVDVRYHKSLTFFHQNQVHRVRCKDCLKFPEIVKLHSLNKKTPPITTADGTKFRNDTVNNHLKSDMHKEAHKAYQQSNLTSVEKLIDTPIGKSINQANIVLANHIGKLLIHVYGGAKKLTASGNTFPARVVIGSVAEKFNFDGFKFEDAELNLQYVTPAGYRELLEIIVESHRLDFAQLLSSSLAASLRCDGSVDRVQIDKIYTMMKCISNTGSEELYFLGAAEPEERGAKGLLGAVKSGCSKTIGSDAQAQAILKKVTSIVTDGASVNTGEKAGLWTLFEEYLKSLVGEGIPMPLLKLWCSVHRSELAWKDVTKLIAEIKLIIDGAVGVTSHFRVSGLRTKELKKLAEEKKLHLTTFPGFFEIRWAEFTAELISSILESWNVLALYFQKLKDADNPEGTGFFNYLTNKDNLELLAFLGDILELLSRLQKNLQKNTTTLVDMMQYIRYICGKLEDLPNQPLLGGWVCALEEQTTKLPNGNYELKQVPLIVPKPRTRGRARNKYVTEKRSPGAVKIEVAQSLSNYLQSRFETDENLCDLLKKFIEFDSTVDLKEVHRILAADLDAASLDIEYSEIISIGLAKNLEKFSLIEKIKKLINVGNYQTVIEVLARIAAAKPHSADVERLISCNNAVKSADRSSLHLDTENLYMYIYFNMPTLELWNPRPAINLWFEKKKRRQKEHPKAKDQTYYNGIFQKAVKSSDEGKGDDPEKKQSSAKKKAF